MIPQHIAKLNRRLGESLGFAGAEPRFAWQWAPDCHYYYRSDITKSFERFCWADRIGKVWVLCQWKAPPMSREDWWYSFQGEFPYPDKGTWYVHGESALPPGIEPGDTETAYYIYELRDQMNTSQDAHYRKIMAGLEKDREDNRKEFLAQAEDSFPAFWKNGQGHEPGTRGAHVSIGGI